jgi:hypothetical protein
MTDWFPPHVLRDYAFIADGERGALIAPRGDISPAGVRARVAA